MPKKKSEKEKIIKKLKTSGLDLLQVITKAMQEYGKHVIENRALPDFRDGLKPVHRRILWSMYKQGNTPDKPFRKSAKTVGDVIGNYHPHGDNAVYDAMVNLTNPVDSKFNPRPLYLNSVTFIAGQGNWGSYSGDSPAAQRYTECKLSPFSMNVFFNKSYLYDSVIDYIPNYSGEIEEPLVLPALLPIALMGELTGIAVGIDTKLPSFKAKGLKVLVSKLLNKEKITYKDCIKHLEFNYPGNPVCLEDKSDFKSLYTTGRGKITFTCPCDINIKAKTLSIRGLTPYLNIEKLMEKINEIDKVESVLDKTDEKNGYNIVIKLQKIIPEKDVEQILTDIAEKYLQKSMSYRINVTIRSKSADTIVSESDAQFEKMSVISLLEQWVKWRVDLELKMLEHHKSILERQIKRLEIFRLAIAKLDIIFKLLKSKSKDLNSELAKAIKIPVEDARIILDGPVRKLSKLSDEDLLQEITKLQNEIKQTKIHIKNPQAKIDSDLKSLPD